MTKLDLRGLRYTMPLVRLATALKAAEPGSVIEAVSDYPRFEQDVQTWCRNTGHELRQVMRDGVTIMAVIVKRDG